VFIKGHKFSHDHARILYSYSHFISSIKQLKDSPIMSASKGSKMLQYINYKMRVTIQDSRVIVGKFMAFDKHMNLILGDAEEFRKIAPKGKMKEEREEKRTLGLILIRGENVVSMSVEGTGPIEENKARLTPTLAGGPGVGRAAGRGMVLPAGVVPPGLGPAPIRGLGGPAPGIMQPGMARGQPAAQAPAVAYGQPGMGRGGPAPGFPGMPPGMPKVPMPPGQFPPGMTAGMPPGMPKGPFPPGQFPPGMPGYPPGVPPGMPLGMPPGMPKGPMPPGQFPPGMPPGMPKGPFPPGQFPPGMGRGAPGQ